MNIVKCTGAIHTLIVHIWPRVLAIEFNIAKMMT